MFAIFQGKHIINFFLLFYLSLLCYPVTQAIPGFRTAACLCNKDPRCKVTVPCENFFVSHKSKETVLFLKTCCLRAERIGFVYYTYTPGGSGDIAQVWLDEKWRGKGLGYVLMQHTLMKLDKASVQQVTLAVHQSLHPAIALYNKCNFVVHEKLDGGSIMIRTLPEKS
jgi:GNAT superfamily N-acetyltransferase